MSQKVSLVVPIYNEIKNLEKFLKKIDDLDLKPFKKELVFVDDFSSDGSKELLKKYQFLPNKLDPHHGLLSQKHLRYRKPPILHL